MPAFWAEVIGDLTFAGAALEPEQIFLAETNRDDTLLVTLTPAHLQHQFSLGQQSEWVLTQPLEKTLKAAEVIWIPPAEHHLRKDRSHNFVSQVSWSTKCTSRNTTATEQLCLIHHLCAAMFRCLAIQKPMPVVRSHRVPNPMVAISSPIEIPTGGATTTQQT